MHKISADHSLYNLGASVTGRKLVDGFYWENFAPWRPEVYTSSIQLHHHFNIRKICSV